MEKQKTKKKKKKKKAANDGTCFVCNGFVYKKAFLVAGRGVREPNCQRTKEAENQKGVNGI